MYVFTEGLEEQLISYGSSGSGTQRNAWRDVKAALNVRAGVNSFFRISKQIDPVFLSSICLILYSIQLFSLLIIWGFQSLHKQSHNIKQVFIRLKLKIFHKVWFLNGLSASKLENYFNS